MNSINLIGNIGRDPVVKATQQGTTVLTFSLAVSNRDKTDWFNCALFGKRADGLAPHLKKGNKVGITGAIHFRQYEKDGHNFTTHDVQVNDIDLLGGRNEKAPAKVAEVPVEKDYGFIPF